MKKSVLIAIVSLSLFLFLVGCGEQVEETADVVEDVEEPTETSEEENLAGEASRGAGHCLISSACRSLHSGDYLMVAEGQTLMNIKGFVSELQVDVGPEGKGAAFTICGLSESMLKGEELPEDGCQEFALKLCETKKVGEDLVQLASIMGETAVLIVG